jgi:hypothetical protein
VSLLGSDDPGHSQGNVSGLNIPKGIFPSEWPGLSEGTNIQLLTFGDKICTLLTSLYQSSLIFTDRNFQKF